LKKINEKLHELKSGLTQEKIEFVNLRMDAFSTSDIVKFIPLIFVEKVHFVVTEAV